MTPRCQARVKIVSHGRHGRTRKEAWWPRTVYGEAPAWILALPECGGELTFRVVPSVTDGCPCCGTATIELSVRCSNGCTAPYWPGALDDPEGVLTKALTAYVVQQQEEQK